MSADYRELLGRALVEIRDLKGRLRDGGAAPRTAGEVVAIQGVAVRFPGAPDVAAFSRLLASGASAVREVPVGRWDVARWYDPDPEAPGRMYVRRGGFLDEVDRFDAALFRISRREAEAMDPQQRWLLETVWTALEDAGVSADALVGSRTGVFVGLSGTEYAQIALQSGVIDAHSGAGVVASVAAGRIAFVLGLRGPALAVDTACSSSLVALHLACASLRARECDRAIVAGVNAVLTPESMVSLCRSRALSPDGLCKTFDARADGYARGEGCGALVLARAAELRPGRDRVRALVRGTAVNHDGRSSGLSVPNGPAQEQVIRAALADAGLDATAISYVEAHGTGTALGDPIELAALASVYGVGRPRERPLLIGSVKTNIGHLESAAGVAGVAKVVLAFEAEKIPAHLHFARPTPHFPWEHAALRVTDRETAWPRDQAPRRAGVSAFGFSGTNAHVVLEEAPASAPRAEAGSGPVLVALSAHTESALDQAAERVAAMLEAEPSVALADVAYTLGVGRGGLRYRSAVVGADRAEVVAGLREKTGLVRRGAASDRPRLAFLFAGQGSQRGGMGRELHETEPMYRDAWDRCAAAARPHLDRDLTEVVWDGGALGQTEWTQPALVALELALSALLRSVGLTPDAVLGHSIGELAAAHVAGVFTLEDVMRLACQRGREMARVPRTGAMAAVFAHADVVEPVVARFAGAAAIAAWNAPEECVVSGDVGALAEIEAEMARIGHRTRRLDVSHAFHSPLMDPAARAFTDCVRGTAIAEPSCAFVSGVTGDLVTDELTRPEYWGGQLREGVRFAGGVAALKREGFRVCLELGPGGELSALALRGGAGGVAAVPLLRRGHGDRRSFFAALAEAYVHGASPDFDGLFRGQDVRRIAVPGTVFERERFWIKDAGPRAPIGGARDAFPGRRVDSPGRESIVEARWSAAALPWLGDHRLFGRIVVPGAAHLARVVAALAGDGATEVRLEDVELPEPLLLGDDEEREVVLLFRAETGGRTFEVASRNGAAWAVHARGRVVSAETLARVIDLEAVRGRCLRLVEGEAFYAAIDETKVIEFGPTFRRIESVHVGGGEALAFLHAPGGGPVPHPGLIDAAFQSLSAAAGVGANGGDAFVPFAIRRLTIRADALPRIAHASVEPGAGPDGLTGTLTLADAGGTVVAELSGVVIRRASRETLLRATGPGAASLFDVQWRSVPRPPLGEARAGRVLVAGGGEAESLAGALRTRGADVSRWEPGREPVDVAWTRAAEGGGPSRLVLVAPTGSGPAGDVSAFEAALAPALALVQEAARRRAPVSLAFVTTAAEAAGDGAPDPCAASLWGFARTVALEHPELGIRLVDRSRATEEGAVADALLRADVEEQLAIVGDDWRVPRVVERKAAPADVVIRADRTIVVTGGLGALGRAVAPWLVRRGARHLLLVGRSEPSPVALAAIRELEVQGAHVRVARADMADGHAVDRLLDEVDRTGPPVAGIVHLAGILDDGLVAGQSWPRVAAVLAGKAVGACHLDRATRRRPLDFFVLVSSLAGVLGSPGQSGYAAANAALDAVAMARRAAGLPGLSVSFGPWAGAGMAERGARPGRQTAEAALAGLGALMAAGASQGIVAPLAELLPPEAWERSVLAEALPRSRVPARETGRDWRRLVGEAPAGERPRVVAEFVGEGVRHVLGAGGDTPLHEDRPLSELGFDSLMALDLRNRVESSLDVGIPVVDIMSGATLRDLTKYVLERFMVARLQGAPAPEGYEEVEL